MHVAVWLLQLQFVSAYSFPHFQKMLNIQGTIQYKGNVYLILTYTSHPLPCPWGTIIGSALARTAHVSVIIVNQSPVKHISLKV